MGFLDALTSSVFKKSEKGHWLFLPWGLIGQRYIIYSEQFYKKLRRKMTICYMLFILIIPIVHVNTLIGLLLVVPVSIGYSIWINRLCRHMTLTDEKPLYAKSLNYQAVARHPMIRWLFLLFAFIVLISSLYALFNDPDKWFLAVLGLVLFGFAVGLFIKMIISRRNLRKKGSPVNK